VNLQNDEDNCGTCGNACSAGVDCFLGECDEPLPPVPVGVTCASDSSCQPASGGLCLTPAQGFPGGYCTEFCSVGSCPAGSLCVDVGAAGDPLPLCFTTCTSSCSRSGYVCDDVGGGLRACFPPS
jgi:hypothetical protein